MMQHYLQTKEEYKDCILFYRLGDFYEMFFEDAKTVSKELELTLTGKSCGLEERAPMCGVPFHAADGYINRLVKKGYKVAICEQVEDPKLAKGIVKREVIRVVTPGTNIDMQSLDEAKNNYHMKSAAVFSKDACLQRMCRWSKWKVLRLMCAASLKDSWTSFPLPRSDWKRATALC